MHKILCLFLPLLSVPFCAQGQVSTRPAGSPPWNISWSWENIGPAKPRVVKLKSKITPRNFRITEKDGLACNFVYSITQLKNGAMVFGTLHGLSILKDGLIKTYTGPEYPKGKDKPIPGNSPLPGNMMEHVLGASDGSLWVAVVQKGLFRFNKGKWKQIKASVPADNKDIFEIESNLNSPSALFETSNGKVVAGFASGPFAWGPAVVVIDSKTLQARTAYLNRKDKGSVNSITEDQKGNLWMTAPSLGVLRYDWKSFKLFTKKEPWIPKENLSLVSLLTIFADTSGNLWLSVLETCLILKKTDGTCRTFTKADVLPDNNVHIILERKNGQVWFGTPKGIAVFNGKQWLYPVFRGIHSPIPCLTVFEARDGSLWICDRQGVVRNPDIEFLHQNPRAIRLAECKKRIENSYPKVKPGKMLARDRQGRVYVYVNEKLLRYDGKKWEDLSKWLKGFGAEFVKADSKGNVWIGGLGPVLISFEGGKVHRHNPNPRDDSSTGFDMAEDSKGRLYFAVDENLYRRSDGRWKEICTDLNGPRVYCRMERVLCDQGDRVWFTDGETLCMYENGQVRWLSNEDPLKGRSIEGIALDKSGCVRISTEMYTANGMERLRFLYDGKRCVPAKEDSRK